MSMPAVQRRSLSGPAPPRTPCLRPSRPLTTSQTPEAPSLPFTVRHSLCLALPFPSPSPPTIPPIMTSQEVRVRALRRHSGRRTQWEGTPPASQTSLPQTPIPPSPPPQIWQQQEKQVGSAPRHAAPRQPLPLRNFGNTCYLNATMQCILRSPWLLSNLARIASHVSRRRRPASIALVEFGATTVSNPGQPLLTIKNEVAKFNDEFSGNGQSDAHEFLRTFLFVVHSEVNRSAGQQTPYVEMKDIENEDEETAMRRWREHLLRMDDSIIYDIFGGVLRSKCVCSSCGNVSLTFDPFLDLSLPMPPLTRKTTSMESLIESNYSDVTEKLSGGNQLLCTKCKRLRNGTRSVKVALWPKVLVLQLNRFNDRGRKNSTPVVYPKKFMTRGENPKRYELYGVVCHEGTENWGHYTSYVSVTTPNHSNSTPPTASLRSNPFIQSDRCASGEDVERAVTPGESWFSCNDATITAISVVDVVKALSQAYMLFYAEV